jgi:hypothetical protein
MSIDADVLAFIVNQHGDANTRGGYLRIKNTSTKYPAYFGLSSVINDKLEPGEVVTLIVDRYRGPKDTASTVQTVTFKYFVTSPKRKK